MNKSILAILLLNIIFFSQCVPPEEEVLTEVNLNFKNKTLQKIYNFQDKQILDSLYTYFRHKDPTFRYASVMAFASIKDETALDSLYPMLNDKIDKVKMAAAYAIGQVGEASDEQKLISAFNPYDTLAKSQANSAILEAIGKSGDEETLAFLSTISTYEPTDTLLLEGHAWGLYRFAYRNMITEEGTETMLNYATDPKYPQSVRLIGANYLNRARNLRFPKNADRIISDALAKEEDPNIRMALAIGLGKTKSEVALNKLVYQYSIEPDYRVRANIVRALSNFEYEQVQPSVFVAMKDKSLPVAITAANFFVDNGTPRGATQYWRATRDTLPWQVQLTLFKAANRYMPYYFSESKKAINWELKQKFEQANDPYIKAAALRSLGEHGWNYKYIRDNSFLSNVPVIKTAGVEALAQISGMDSEDFRKFFGNSYRRVRKEIGDYFLEAIVSGDAGMTYEAAKALREPKSFFKGTVDSLHFLDKALEKLSLPQEIESYNELQKTISYFKDTEYTGPKTPDYNHPIDFRVLNSIEENTKINIKTSKGDIKLSLMPESAPGTVANFIQLIKIDHFTGKNFHRVVPNFVIQGGCPRGDGYGSLDYTIRSELPYLHYDSEGYVGMASAGNHTECTQFFITHSPTPHLDGNYTIFAKVSEGMDVVHQIEVGDVIEKVEIQN